MLRKTDYNEPHILDLNRMNNQMKMNQMNTIAMKKREIQPEVLMTKQEVKEFVIDDDRPDVIGDKYKKAAALQEQALRLTKNAIVDELGFVPKVIKSDVTQKMIDEYRAEQNKPIIINGKNYKYHPSNVDTTLEAPNLKQVFSAAEILNGERAKADLVKQYTKINFNITKKLPLEEQRSINVYNKAKANEVKAAAKVITPEAFERLREQTASAQNIFQQRPIAAALNIVLDPNISVAKRRTVLMSEIDRQSQAPPAASQADADFEVSKNTIAAKYASERQALLDIQGQIDAIDLAIADNIKTPSENRIEINRVDKINKDKLSNAVADLKTLNSGLMVPDKQLGESDEEFRQRLIDVGTTEIDDATVESNANLVNIVRAKGNLKDILSDEGTISTIIKKLTKDEVFVMNKKWEAIKKKFLETYGYNNKQVNDQDIVDFVRQMLNYMGGEIAVNPAKVVAKPAPEIAPTHSILSDSRFVALSNKIPFPTFKLATDYLGIPRQTTRADSLTKLLEQGYDNVLKIEDLASKQQAKLIAEAGGGPGAGAAEVAPLVGHGIHLPDYPKYIKLGAIHIDPKSLHFHNILKIRGNKGKNGEHYRFVGINDVKISDVLREIIIKLSNGETITKYDTNMLDSHDKIIYDNLMIVAKLHRSHESTVGDTAKHLKIRFEILEGEIAAGNDNPKLKKELYDVLHQMAHHGIVSKWDARRYWAEMNNAVY